jgi:hypothetical protein
VRDELLMRPADDPSIEQAENLIRRLSGCDSPESAANLAAHELPALVGADWATFTPASAYAGNPADQPWPIDASTPRASRRPSPPCPSGPPARPSASS